MKALKALAKWRACASGERVPLRSQICYLGPGITVFRYFQVILEMWMCM